MFGLLKSFNLKRKQEAINRKFPGVKIFLHREIPMSAINTVVRLAADVDAVNKLEPSVAALSDDELSSKTAFFRNALAERSREIEREIAALEETVGTLSIPEERDRVKEKLKRTRNAIFDGIRAEAFAVVREAARRTIGLRHYDVQIAGGTVLHEGTIAEMATGEGKTLVATLPAYLNALLGKGVHVVTVNDYLAKRDSEWMGPVYRFLGLTVGVIQHDMSDADRKAAYACDITYGTNNEFGFDYLRDNMKYEMQDLVQRGFYYAIVDEVDSILIDEARTPLIISGAAEESTDKYYTAERIVRQLSGRRVTESQEVDAKHKGEDLGKGFDYMAYERANSVALTDEGEAKVSRLWGVDNLHSMETMEQKHHTIQALRAREFFRKDTEYIVKDGQVIIVDEFTGRLMPGRRWSDGLHQAIEAKEGMKIEQENQTLATITFQNYFRMYEKLSGMTGTAFTEANEFKAIYKLDVITMPTNRPLIRRNYPDCVYKTEQEKFDAVVNEIAGLHEQGRPVLVGTISIEKSERLSAMLKRRGIAHQVLNAKYHEMEAQIVAQAGRHKAVTIATNMAGRGTDILLGGNPEFMAKNLLKQTVSPEDPPLEEEYRKLLEKFRKQTDAEHEAVVSAGGLHVLGTERHEARRIDNQLRGRQGRQGDPGSSRFYVSFQDDLLRMFAPEWIIKMLNGIDTEGEPLTLKEGRMAHMISRSIETAQRRVEQHNFEIRKQLLEYDNVMNKQREIVYGQRRQVLEGLSLRDEILGYSRRVLGNLVATGMQEELSTEEEAAQMQALIKGRFGLELSVDRLSGKTRQALEEEIGDALAGYYDDKEKSFGPDAMRYLERFVMLNVIDSRWKDHLYSMDKLREGIGLRAYGSRDPLIEYKNEAFAGFKEMVAGIEEETVERVFKVQARRERDERIHGVFSSVPQQLSHPQAAGVGGDSAPARAPSPAFSKAKPAGSGTGLTATRSAGRNDPCPCGSGKKFKKCCGK